MTVVPVNVEAVKKQEEKESKDAWKTPGGWVFPGKKTMIESNKHPNKPHISRVEELSMVITTSFRNNSKIDHFLDILPGILSLDL